MNPTIYRQYDSRWADLPYPTSSSPVSTDGCGLCSVTNSAIELDKYWDATPKTFYSFMKQYAVAGNGTLWDGIDAGLKNFIGNCKRFDEMTPFWNEVAKGNRVGVILFRNGSAPDGTVWTSSGHYLSFVSYKYLNGEHWLYMKDSGSRCHDGWYCYEESMRGCIRLLWTAEVINVKNGWYKEGNHWYYYKSGKMVKNDWAQDSKGLWYWLGKDGKMVKSGLITWKGDKYYLKSDGVMASNEWIKFENGWRFFNKSGKMRIGWLKWKSNFYYLDSKGYMVTGGRNVPCTFDSDGKMVIK